MSESEARLPNADLAQLRAERAALARAARIALGEERWERPRPLIDAAAFAAFLIVLTALLVRPGTEAHLVPLLGTSAPTTIRAERDLLLRDTRATALRREEALARVGAVFDYDSELYYSLGEDVLAAFQDLSERLRDPALTPIDRRTAFEDDLGAPVKAGTFVLLEQLRDPLEAALSIQGLLNLLLDRRIVADRESLPERGFIEVRDKVLGHVSRQHDIARVLDVRQARRLLSARAGDAVRGPARIVRSWVLDTARTLVRPNLAPDPATTKARREEAVQAVEPVFLRLRAGDVVVRRGAKVDQTVQERIRALNAAARTERPWLEAGAVALVVFGLVLLAGLFFRDARRPLYLDRRGLYMTLSIALIGAAVSMALHHVGLGLSAAFDVPAAIATVMVPIGLATVLTSLLVNARVSLLVGICLALLMTYRVDGDSWLMSLYVVGVMAGGIVARRCQKRADLLRAGLAIAGAQILLLPIASILGGAAFATDALALIGAIAVSGLVVGLAALGFLPALETVFDESTDLRLLELASGENRRIKELALRSPGTYYHSLMVANLAETGADAIGANGLRARVMALYHDIGKTMRPAYFAENMREGNVHDRLSPIVSARVVFDHIRHGIELARRDRLGRAALEGITQHQGTGRLAAFEDRARREGLAVEDEDFRYPGPRPRRPEAGVLLLADSIEAATRSMGKPAPKDVAERVNLVIDQKIADGQLDDCGLSLRDLAVLRESFVRVLTLGVFHNRIDYPPVAQRPPRDSETTDDGDNRHRDNVRPLAG